MSESKIEEHDIVVLREQVQGIAVNVGTPGVVVYLYADGKCAEVEFVCDKVSALITETVELSKLYKYDCMLDNPAIVQQLDLAKERLRKRTQDLND